METVNIVLDNQGQGKVQLMSSGQEVGTMDISASDDTLTVYHTEVNPEHEGKGFAKLLLNELVGYARENHLKIKPLCPYVHAQFKRYPDMYQNVWNGD